MQVILAGWNNFRSVISGFEVINESPKLAFETTQATIENDNTKIEKLDQPETNNGNAE